MGCVGGSWVVLGCGSGGLVVGWFSSSSYVLLLLGCCGSGGREVV